EGSGQTTDSEDLPAGEENWLISITLFKPEKRGENVGRRGRNFVARIDAHTPGEDAELLSRIRALQKHCKTIKGRESFTHERLEHTSFGESSWAFIQVPAIDAEHTDLYYMFAGNLGRPKPAFVVEVEQKVDELIEMAFGT